MTAKFIKISITLFLFLNILILNISAMAFSEIEVFYDDSSYNGMVPAFNEVPVLVVCDNNNNLTTFHSRANSAPYIIQAQPGEYTVYFVALAYVPTLGSALTDNLTLQAVCNGNTEYVYTSSFTIEDGQRAVVNADGSPDYLASGGPTAGFDFDDLFLVDTNTVSTAGVTALDLFFLGSSNYGDGSWPLSSIDRFCLNGSLITTADFDSFNFDPTAGPIESRINVAPGLYEFSDYSFNSISGTDECETEVFHSVNVSADQVVDLVFSMQLSPQSQFVGFNVNTVIESLNDTPIDNNNTPTLKPSLGLIRTGGADN
jgi:hypothetical protein